MKAPAIPLSSFLLALAISASGNALAQQTASDTDKAFVAKVSQGRYEVEASKLALQKASTQNVKDAANSEVHDHEPVNKKLKTISRRLTYRLRQLLNPDFTQKLDHLKILSAEEFDKGYMEEMAAIHDKMRSYLRERQSTVQTTTSRRQLGTHFTEVRRRGLLRYAV